DRAAGDRDETLALHAAHHLGHGRARHPQPLGDPGLDDVDLVLAQLVDRLAVLLECGMPLGGLVLRLHRCQPTGQPGCLARYASTVRTRSSAPLRVLDASPSAPLSSSARSSSICAYWSGSFCLTVPSIACQIGSSFLIAGLAIALSVPAAATSFAAATSRRSPAAASASLLIRSSGARVVVVAEPLPLEQPTSAVSASPARRRADAGRVPVEIMVVVKRPD